jgi:hypothetical protein
LTLTLFTSKFAQNIKNNKPIYTLKVIRTLWGDRNTANFDEQKNA